MDPKERLERALDALVDLSEAPSPLGAALSAEGSTSGEQVWDRESFLARVQTFRTATWFAKPASISPVECARHGWRNVGPDTLHCEVRTGSNRGPGRNERTCMP